MLSGKQEGKMLIHVFKSGPGLERGLTADKSGANLPKDGRPWPWVLEKTLDIGASDGPRIGASSGDILDGIAKDGYFIWPAGKK
jgi:hypothetical protein